MSSIIGDAFAVHTSFTESYVYVTPNVEYVSLCDGFVGRFNEFVMSNYLRSVILVLLAM